jgi:hypothetical protein
VVTIVIAIPWSPLLLMFHGRGHCCYCCFMIMVAFTTTVLWSWLPLLLLFHACCHHCCCFESVFTITFVCFMVVVIVIIVVSFVEARYFPPILVLRRCGMLDVELQLALAPTTFA